MIAASIAFFVTWDAQGLIMGHPLEFWNSADIILDGTVISTTKIESEQLVEHNIKVEQYFKNPKPQQMITVYGPDIYNEKWFYPKFFKEGDRALFYLKKIDDKYIILPHSILATEKCSPRDMIGLSTLPGEPIGRGGPTLFFDPYQTCNGYLYPAWYLATTLTPLKQHEAGIKNEDIHCNEGLARVIKLSDNIPICVKSGTVSKLVKRGVISSTFDTTNNPGLVISRGDLLTQNDTHREITILSISPQNVTLPEPKNQTYKTTCSENGVCFTPE